MKKIIFSNPIKHKLKFSEKDLKKNAVFIIFYLLFLAGIVIGSIYGQKADSDLMKKLDFIFLTNFDVRCSQGIFSAFTSSFATAFIFLLIIFLFGLSIWGGILVGALPFFKGYGYGLSVGYLYSAYGFYGVMYNILIILPGAFVCSLVVVAASQESLKNSFGLMSYFRYSAVNQNPHIKIRKYMISMLWFFVLIAFSSVIDMLFSLCFSWIFN